MQHSFCNYCMFVQEKGWKSGYIHGSGYFHGILVIFMELWLLSWNSHYIHGSGYFHGILATFMEFCVCASEGVELWLYSWERVEIWLPGILLAPRRYVRHGWTLLTKMAENCNCLTIRRSLGTKTLQVQALSEWLFTSEYSTVNIRTE